KDNTIWYGLEDQMGRTARNALLIAPQLPKKIADGRPGKLAAPGASAAFLGEARDVLAKKLGFDALFAGAFDAAPIILMSYSGGYRAATCVIDSKSGVPSRVKAVFMLDSLYGNAGTVEDWIKASKGGSIFLSLARQSDPSTWTPSLAVANAVGGSAKLTQTD